MSKYRFAIFTLFTLFILFVASSAFAQFIQNRWHSPTFSNPPASSMDSSGVPVRVATSISWQRAITTGANNDWFFAWTGATNSNRTVYCGRIDIAGDTLWKRTVNAAYSFKDVPMVVGTSDGGVIVSWVSFTIDSGSVLGSLMVQKLDMNGNRLWNVSGATDSTHAVLVTTTTVSYNPPKMISDGASGCYLVWFDRRSESSFYGTRVTSNGTIANGFRTNGTPLLLPSNNAYVESDFGVISDNRGGAWLATTLNRFDSVSICLQQLRSDGTTRWDSLGNRLLINQYDYMVRKLQCVADGRGGGFVVWEGGYIDIFMQRFDTTGHTMWLPDNGAAIGTWANEQTNPNIISAGMDTCIVSWEDFRTDPTNSNNSDIYVQKITGNSLMVRVWDADGVPVCIAQNRQANAYLGSDGTNGCVLSWEDERDEYAPKQDIYAQHIDYIGIPEWALNGIAVAAYTNGQTLPVGVVNYGRILFLWADARIGSMPIYRRVFSMSGQGVYPFEYSSAKTVDDLSGDVVNHTLIKQGSTRVIDFWVDPRRSQYGNRIYFSQYDVGTGTQVSSTPNGTPITIDSSYFLDQGGTYYYNTLLAVETPDSASIVIYQSQTETALTLRAQKISYTGNRLWGAYGLEVGSPNYDFTSVKGYLDGNGGVYFIYTSTGAAPFYYSELRLQHINSNGQRDFPDPSPVVNANDQQYSNVVVSNGVVYLGYILSLAEDNWNYRVQLSRMNADGTARWTHSISFGYDTSMTNGSRGTRTLLNLMPGSNGSVIATWCESFYGIQGDYQLCSQKIDSSGNFLWGPVGKRVSPTTYTQYIFQTVKSGNNYWYLWQESRATETPTLFLQQLTDDGQMVFDSSGIAVPHNGTVWMSNQILLPDASSGVYISYALQSYLAPTWSYFLQGLVASHYNQSGEVEHSEIWNPGTQSGVAFVAKMSLDDYIPTGVSTSDGAIISWQDGRAILGWAEEGWYSQHDLYIQRITDNNVSVREVSAPVPKLFTLEQNYPNPFNSTTHFKFTLPNAEKVKLVIYDVTGREVIRLLDEVKMTGTYDVRWNGKNSAGQTIASGLYFCRLQTSSGAITKKMTLLK